MAKVNFAAAGEQEFSGAATSELDSETSAAMVQRVVGGDVSGPIRLSGATAVSGGFGGARATIWFALGFSPLGDTDYALGPEE